jgi:hypothetical protein
MTDMKVSSITGKPVSRVNHEACSLSSSTKARQIHFGTQSLGPRRFRATGSLAAEGMMRITPTR